MRIVTNAYKTLRAENSKKPRTHPVARTITHPHGHQSAGRYHEREDVPADGAHRRRQGAARSRVGQVRGDASRRRQRRWHAAQGRQRDRACARNARADRVQRPNPTVRGQPDQKWRQYSLTAFSRFRTAPIFQPLLAPARYKGCGSTKARDVPPPMPRIVRPGGRQRRLELDAAPDGQAHSPPTAKPPSPLAPAAAASSQQSPQGSVSGREPTAHCASCDPPCAFRPRRLIAEPPTSSQPAQASSPDTDPQPQPTARTHPSPINRRSNRLKFFHLAPNGSPPSPSLSSTSPLCTSVIRVTGTHGQTS